MDAALLKQKLHDYIDTAEEKKLEAIYTILESEMEYNWRKDEEWIAELKRREEEIESGKVKGLSWDEVKNNIRKAASAKKLQS